VEDVYSSSIDGAISIYIPQGTIMKGPDGGMVTLISTSLPHPYPTPPKGYAIVEAFEFQPTDATFDPAINITVNTNQSTPSIASYNPANNEWTFLEGVIDLDRHEITFNVNHFSIYAILAYVGYPPTPASTHFSYLTWIPVIVLWFAAFFFMFLAWKRHHRLAESNEPAEFDDWQY